MPVHSSVHLYPHYPTFNEIDLVRHQDATPEHLPDEKVIPPRQVSIEEVDICPLELFQIV